MKSEVITRVEIVRRMLAYMDDDLCTGANSHSPRAVKMAIAAELTGVGRTTMYGLVMSGQIRSLKIGSRRLVPLSAIDDFVERNSRPPDEVTEARHESDAPTLVRSRVGQSTRNQDKPEKEG